MGLDKEKQIHATMPEEFPPTWASAWGEDRDYGLWCALTYKGISQRFRWIKPGRFMMGSPVDEPERFDSETLHEVVLTEGFWLAETACTQEFWEAVTGENPSHFSGAKRPVETVSWQDCVQFVDKINGLLPGLDLRLPSEAEWEYACRAGTSTPFSFGDTITAEQVNLSMETVKVGSLPCNPWGLYEMHGNIFEWCADWYGKYPSGPVVNPLGPEQGVIRVLRGGCWGINGRFVRSAFRNRIRPGSRNQNIGFRLARGQKKTAGQRS